MSLDYEKLIRFDLLKDVERGLMNPEGLESLRDLFTVMQEISSTDQFIKESPSFPGSTDTIVRDELISAVGSTLAIEGTVLAKEEIEESFLKADGNEKLRRKQQEAENSRKVYHFVIDLVTRNQDGFTYNEQMIRQMHAYFTNEMHYVSNVPGEYRTDFPARFGYPTREGLCKTRPQIEEAMSNLVRWLNEPGQGILENNVIVKAIMAHYYLTEIHPFGDGNGRTARALEALVLYVNGINHYCFWSLANFWSSNRNEYIIKLGSIYSTCNPWDFLIWGMKGYFDEIKRVKGLVLRKVKQLMLMDYARYLLDNKRKQQIKINQRIVEVLRLLVYQQKVPVDVFLSSPQVAALYRNVSAATRWRDFNKMKTLGLIRVSKENDRPFMEPNFEKLETVTYSP
jgi:Fic family protein